MMEVNKYQLLLLSLWLMVYSCAMPHRTEEPLALGSLQSRYTPSFAKGFAIEYYEDAKVLVLYDLESEEKQETQRLRIASGEGKNIGRKFACLSTTHLSYFQSLSAAEKVLGVAHRDLLKDPVLRQMADNGGLQDLGGSAAVDPELLLDIGATIFFTYPFGQPSFDRYSTMGIQCVPVSEYLELHPLGRSEWLMFFAAFLDEEDKASEILEGIVERYTQSQASVKKLSNELGQENPVVLIASESNGFWYAPSGESCIARLVTDAGGNYLLKDRPGTANVTLQFEELLHLGQNLDYWGIISYENEALRVSDLLMRDHRLFDMLAVKTGQMFVCNTSEVDYFGAAMVDPNPVLEDLMCLLYPTHFCLRPEVYFKKMPT